MSCLPKPILPALTHCSNVIFRPKSTINGQLPFSEIYVDSNEFLEAKQPNGMKIFQFHCPLFFMNAHNFKTNLYNKALDISKYVQNKAISANF